MKCKGCNEPIDGNNFKKVAKWTFCLKCFENLMAPGEAPKTHDPVPEEHSKEVMLCSLCGIPIEASGKKELGIWELCDSCYQDLIMCHRSRSEDASSGEESDISLGEMDDTEFQLELEAERKARNKEINCAGCGRNILEVAAKELDGELFCPDCFYKKQQTGI